MNASLPRGLHFFKDNNKMKKILAIIPNGLLVGTLLTSCTQKNSETKFIKSDSIITESLIADSIALVHQDSINKAYEAKQKKAIVIAEKDLISSIQEFDREFGENNYTRLRKVLKKHKTTPYNLYLELVNIYQKSYAESVQMAINAGLKERKYTDFIAKVEDKYISQFQLKYGIDDGLYRCFKNNYCSCYTDNSDQYCSDGQPIFPNGEFWKLL